ncbi:MAG: hypothetical protein EBY21_10170 [Alphaproteobacteria bacterium]|nr:hypothetical protein [Alphaproteobacteria bacterium]
MHNQDLNYFFKDVANWAEPLIADQIYNLYASLLKTKDLQGNHVVIQHRLFWRYLLSGQEKLALHARRELQNKARVQTIPLRALDEMDRLILDELMNVMVTRFHRSPLNVRNYGRTFIAIASQLTETRLAAA